MLCCCGNAAMGIEIMSEFDRGKRGGHLESKGLPKKLGFPEANLHRGRSIAAGGQNGSFMIMVMSRTRRTCELLHGAGHSSPVSIEQSWREPYAWYEKTRARMQFAEAPKCSKMALRSSNGQLCSQPHREFNRRKRGGLYKPSTLRGFLPTFIQQAHDTSHTHTLVDERENIE